MNLLTVSTAKETDLILSALRAQAGDAIGSHVHLGGKDADFKASSLSRMNRAGGTLGHLFEGDAYAGAARDLINAPDLEDAIALFTEELARRGSAGAYLSHPLTTPHDYRDYFHILADAAAGLLREKEITHLLFFNVPHLAQDTIFYLVARAMGLKTLILAQSLEPGRFFSMANPMELGSTPWLDPDATPHKIEKGAPLDLFYMSGVGQEKAAPGTLGFKACGHLLAHLVFKEPALLLRPRAFWGLLRRMVKVARAFPKWRDPFARFFNRAELDYFEHLAGYEKTEVDLERRFVYVPLQFQPEMTSTSLGGVYVNQALMVETLRDTLPDDVAIYVKENPKQGGYQRGPLFFHRLSRIAGVQFLPSHIDTKLLTAKSECVATVTGTVGWEAIRQGKPAIVFGAAWFQDLPGVYRYTRDLDYQAIVNTKIDHEALERAAGGLFARAHNGVVNRHYSKIIDGFDADQNAQTTAQVIWQLLNDKADVSFKAPE